MKLPSESRYTASVPRGLIERLTRAHSNSTGVYYTNSDCRHFPFQLYLVTRRVGVMHERIPLAFLGGEFSTTTSDESHNGTETYFLLGGSNEPLPRVRPDFSHKRKAAPWFPQSRTFLARVPLAKRSLLLHVKQAVFVNTVAFTVRYMFQTSVYFKTMSEHFIIVQTKHFNIKTFETIQVPSSERELECKTPKCGNQFPPISSDI